MVSIDHPGRSGSTISFGQSLARSKRFDALFDEGMRLVEEAANYLDGKGRTEAQALRFGLKSAYAAESLRLTTRLMQIASWLLIRRAIVEGDMAAERAGQDRSRLNLSAQQLISPPAVFAQMPDEFQRLATSSLRLQTRVLHLDRMVNLPAEPSAERSGFDQQIALLQSAFATAS